MIVLQKVYSTPLIGPAYLRPPSEFKGSRQVTIIFKTDREILDALVPQPLKLNAESVASFYFRLFSVPAYDVRYMEVGIMIPVTCGEMRGLFFTHLYLDLPFGIVAGREVWGYPKKDANLEWKEEGSVISLNVTRLGTPLIKATLQKAQRVEHSPLPAPQAYFNLKVIPSVKRDAPPDILQLTSVPTRSDTKETSIGSATLEFRSGPQDPLGQIPVRAIVTGLYTVGDFTLDCGEVVIDYLHR